MKVQGFLITLIVLIMMFLYCSENPIGKNDCGVPHDAPIQEGYVNMRNTSSRPYQYSLGIESVKSDYSNFTAGVAWGC